MRQRGGARLVVGRDVLSEIRSTPGPTHSFFDVLAAVVVALSPTGRKTRLAVLGFAGGGLVAPLRGMGFGDRIDAVDHSRRGQSLFRELTGPWGEPVRIAHAEASRWLRARRRPYDLILDDLSVPVDGGTIKPAVSLDTLPRIMHRRVGPRGAAITNLLPVPGISWSVLLAGLADGWPDAIVIRSMDFENRLLVAGRRLPAAVRLAPRVRAALRAIGSRQATRIALRSL